MNEKLIDLIFAFRYFFSPNFKNEINKVNFNEKRIVIFDVGSYHGQFINEIGFINKKKLDIHFFEPVEDDYKILKSKLNKTNNYKFNQVAVSNKSGFMTFYQSSIPTISSFNPKKNFDNFYIFSRYLIFKFMGYKNINLKDTFKTIKVNTISISEYCNKNNIKKINILKLDTEGHDIECLLGAKQLLNQNLIDVIQLEIICKTLDDKIFQLNKIKENLPNYYLLTIKKHPGLFFFGSKIKLYDLLFINKKIKI
tara:strand:- start:2113 stop:2871 length:759 start_codon:yes stop_codon:yes gene_type:complete